MLVNLEKQTSSLKSDLVNQGKSKLELEKKWKVISDYKWKPVWFVNEWYWLQQWLILNKWTEIENLKNRIKVDNVQTFFMFKFLAVL